MANRKKQESTVRLDFSFRESVCENGPTLTCGFICCHVSHTESDGDNELSALDPRPTEYNPETR